MASNENLEYVLNKSPMKIALNNMYMLAHPKQLSEKLKHYELTIQINF